MDVYEILKELGKGSYGRTYLAVKRKIKCVIQVSKLKDNGLFIRKNRCAFQEIKNLRHSHVTIFYDSFATGNLFCVVTEYCSGGNLKDFIIHQNGIFLPESFILDLFVQLGLALNFLHEKKIIHRNINSRCIFFSHDGVIKLGNFQNAVYLNKLHTDSEPLPKITNYTSPEVIKKKSCDIASDMWSLGCVLYETTCLRHAFYDSNETVMILKILSSSIQPIPNHYSNDLKSLIILMLQKNQDNRPLMKSVLRYSFLLKRALKYSTEKEFKDLKIGGKINFNKFFELNTNTPTYSKSIHYLPLVPNSTKGVMTKEENTLISKLNPTLISGLNPSTCTSNSTKNISSVKKPRCDMKKYEAFIKRGSLSDRKISSTHRKDISNKPTFVFNNLRSSLAYTLDQNSKIISKNRSSNFDIKFPSLSDQNSKIISNKSSNFNIKFPSPASSLSERYGKKFLEDILSPSASFSCVPKTRNNILKCFKNAFSTLPLYNIQKDLNILSDISNENLLPFYVHSTSIGDIFLNCKISERIFNDLCRSGIVLNQENFLTEIKSILNKEMDVLISHSKEHNILPLVKILSSDEIYNMIDDRAPGPLDHLKELRIRDRNCLCLILGLLFKYIHLNVPFRDVTNFDLKLLENHFQKSTKFRDQLFITTVIKFLPANPKTFEHKVNIVTTNTKFSTTITIIPTRFKSALSFSTGSNNSKHFIKLESFSLYLPYSKQVNIFSEEMHTALMFKDIH